MKTIFALPIRRALIGGTIALAVAAAGTTVVTSAIATPNTTDVATVALEGASLDQLVRSDVLTNDNYIGAGSSLTSLNGAYRMDMQDDGNLVVYRTKDNEPLWASGTEGKGAVRVHIQPDGNFVLYTAKDVAVWDTDTAVDETEGRTSIVRMANDGSLRIERGTNVAWSTPADPTAPKPTPTSPRPTATSPKPTSPRPTATSSRPTATTTRPVPTTSRPVPTSSRPVPTSARPTAPRPTGTTRPPAPVEETTILPGRGFNAGGYMTSQNGKYRFGLDASGTAYLQVVSTRQQLWSMRVKNEVAAQFGLNKEGNLVFLRRDGVTLWSTKFATSDDARLVIQNDGNVVLYHGDDAVWATNTVQA